MVAIASHILYFVPLNNLVTFAQRYKSCAFSQVTCIRSQYFYFPTFPITNTIMSGSDGEKAQEDSQNDDQQQNDQFEGEIEGQVDEIITKQVEDDPLSEDTIEKAGEAARAAQKANLQAAKTKDPEERKRLLTEAANNNKTVQTLQSGTLQGAAAGGGIGLATGAGLGTVVGTVVGGVSFPCSRLPAPLIVFTWIPALGFIAYVHTSRMMLTKDN